MVQREGNFKVKAVGGPNKLGNATTKENKPSAISGLCQNYSLSGVNNSKFGSLQGSLVLTTAHVLRV